MDRKTGSRTERYTTSRSAGNDVWSSLNIGFNPFVAMENGYYNESYDSAAGASSSTIVGDAFQGVSGLAGGLGLAAGGASLAGLEDAAVSRWSSRDALNDHFIRHGADFGSKSARAYSNQAAAFLRNGITRRLPTKIASDGTVRIYDPDTNTFGSYRSDGSVKTLFKPPGGLSYWNKQIGKSPW